MRVAARPAKTEVFQKEREDLDDMLHEDSVVADEMVRWQHHQARLGIASQNPVRRQQDGRCGTPIFGLLQNMERRGFVA
jgi:hypothetical protein